MSDETLDAQARSLYDACQTPKPDWDQLGDTTKNVWRSYVNKDPAWPFLYSVPSHPSVQAARDETLSKVSKIKLGETPIEHVVPSNISCTWPACMCIRKGANPCPSSIEISVTTLEKVAEKIPEPLVTVTTPHPRPLTLKEKLALKGLK